MFKKILQFLDSKNKAFKSFPGGGYLYLIYLKIIGYIFFFIEFIFPLKKSSTPIDIIITLAPKDLDKLENCLIGIKNNILHPISKIFIIGSKSNELDIILKKFKCEHVNEEELLNKNELNIKYIHNNIDRSGWLFQQLLNYQGVSSLGNENFKLAINSDTVFSKKQKFIKDGKMVFNASNTYHYPYFSIASKLLDLNKTTTVSFTSHHILYNKKIFKQMINYIEKKYNKKWYKAILDNLNYSILSNHSDFETYAQFAIKNYKKSITIEYFFNKDIYEKDLKNFSKNFQTFFYKSLSFHDYLYKK
jgi:hypothetical protein